VAAEVAVSAQLAETHQQQQQAAQAAQDLIFLHSPQAQQHLRVQVVAVVARQAARQAQQVPGLVLRAMQTVQPQALTQVQAAAAAGQVATLAVTVVQE
jgi:hypothetical protein